MAGPFKCLPILLLALFTFSVSGDLIVSINCGETKKITDSNLEWTPDDDLISNGLARVVSNNSISPVMNTLRVFTTRKRNCYSYPVTQDTKVLIRASFNYGNYDRLSKPPTFDLHFDGNLWATVETSASEVITHEVTYVAKRDSVSVCVAQTQPNQFPFMSALEIRGVHSDVYSKIDDSRALFLVSRLSYGATQDLRYPDDEYDRIWVPASLSGSKTVTTEASTIDPTGTDTNNPPTGILENAVESTSNALLLATIPPLNNFLMYINMYFSEVDNHDSTQTTRSFTINEESTAGTKSSDTVSPPYAGVEVWYFNDYSVVSYTNISLVATRDSDLPPFINALEAFLISGVLTDGTDSNDLDALALLQSTFDVLGGWTGDPCLPATYSWDWLNCSDDATPRVTALYLNGFELSGELPDISSMDALEIIDLHNNSLTGTIPSFFGTMLNLRQLNLAVNRFSGSIPTTFSQNSQLKWNVTGNPGLCTGKSCLSSPTGIIDSSPGSTNITKKKKSSSLPVVLGTTIPIFFLLWVAAGAFIILRKKRKPINTKLPIVTGGGANGNSNGLHKTDEEMVNVVPQTYGSPSPLLDDDHHHSGHTSDRE